MDAHAEGREAYDAGEPDTANPYDPNVDGTAYWAWDEGWLAAERDAPRNEAA